MHKKFLRCGPVFRITIQTSLGTGTGISRKMGREKEEEEHSIIRKDQEVRSRTIRIREEATKKKSNECSTRVDGS